MVGCTLQSSYQLVDPSLRPAFASASLMRFLIWQGHGNL
jgi:hypothetical protein